MDMENGAFADPARIHPFSYEGKYLKVQGPLKVIPSPRCQPYLFQAGQSERGFDFGAKHGECIFAGAMGTQQMRSLCDGLASEAQEQEIHGVFCNEYERGTMRQRMTGLRHPATARSKRMVSVTR